MFLEIHDLKKSFGSGNNRTEVLKGIEFTANKGEICVLLASFRLRKIYAS